MNPVPPRPLFRRTFDAAALTREHPPRFESRNKIAVHERLRAGPAPQGTVRLSRWSEGELPFRRPSSRPAITARAGFFEYDDDASPGTMPWHLNFAMDDCFGAYAGGLLAQDELQVLEHPVLASLREASSREGFSLLCVERGRPTPVLVAGAERRGALETAPSPSLPRGLYGNEFRDARPEQVLEALTVLDPPTRSNIVAIEAPACGRGPYRRDEIAFVVATACSGFRAAVLESRHGRAKDGPAPRTVIHTGFWGAGAYGGDRELMALLQLVAAELAGVDEVVFHAARGDGPRMFEAALRRYDSFPETATTEEILDAVLARGYAWGVSNGT